MAFESSFARQPHAELCLCPEEAFPKGNEVCQISGAAAGRGRQASERRGTSQQHRGGFTGLAGSRRDVSIPTPPLPPGYASCRTAQTGSIGSRTPVPSSLGHTGSNKVPARDAGPQSFLLLQHHPGGDHPKSFYPQGPLLPILPPLIFNRKHFQEQEVLLSRHSLSITETSSQPGTQIFS